MARQVKEAMALYKSYTMRVHPSPILSSDGLATRPMAAPHADRAGFGNDLEFAVWDGAGGGFFT